jgi:hypothetical protein
MPKKYLKKKERRKKEKITEKKRKEKLHPNHHLRVFFSLEMFNALQKMKKYPVFYE